MGGNKYENSYKYIEEYFYLYPVHQLDKEHLGNIKELVDKATPKKRIFVKENGGISAHDICPVCKNKVSPIRCYCDNCGQRLEE